ncbi:MAG: hypothetical protein K5871_03165 [Lachnospiraceae bacterium]|nr:hypothetical protein [Lachnospiraceae bacterium]
MGLTEMALSGYLCVLSVSDIRFRAIRGPYIIIGIVAGMIHLIMMAVSGGPLTERFRMILVALLGALPGLLITILSFYTDKVGRGDGLVLMIIGLFESCMMSSIIICMGCMMLGAVSIVLLMFHKVSRNTQMPYIPFVTLSYILLKSYEGSYLGI